MGPMVEFIAQMIEYNETLILYRIFIEKIDFFQLFFSIPGTSGTIQGSPGAVWDRKFYEKLWFIKAFSKIFRNVENRFYPHFSI